MYFSTRARHVGRSALWPSDHLAWKMSLTLWLMLSTAFLAKEPGGTIAGTVETQQGKPIGHTEIIATSSEGRVVSTTLSDDRGRFQFHPIHPGIYQVEVEPTGQWIFHTKHAEIKDGKKVLLNFIGLPADQYPPNKSNILGPISFYRNSDFKGAQLRDPSGGGGYNNAASAEASQMLKQYLAARKLSANGNGSRMNVKHEGTPDAGEEDLEESGSKLLARQDYPRAVQLLKRATTLYPHSEHLRVELGLSLYGAGKYKTAVIALSDAARLSPDDPQPVLMLAEASQFASSPVAASLIKRFSELHPNSAEGHYAYGLYLWRNYNRNHNLNLRASAETEFKKASRLDPNNAAAHLQLGMIYDEQNATDQAVLEYLAAVQANPKLAAAHYRLAQDYKRLGEKTKATTEFTQYEKLRGNVSP